MNVFVLTGAGISAESGLGTFRNKERTGLWARFDPMKLATPEAFARDPDAVHAFYNLRRRNLIAAAPNAAHSALARLEKSLATRGGELTLVTQNIDDLHERAGSRRVIHMHGEMLKARCVCCDHVATWRDDLGVQIACPACRVAGGMRPHVVWFGEVPLEMAVICDILARAERFVAIGTSGAVYPAAGFVAMAREAGIAACEINLEPSDNAHLFDETRYGPASEVVPAWTNHLLASIDAGEVEPGVGRDLRSGSA
jgi:NAD-dependent deacetylase